MVDGEVNHQVQLRILLLTFWSLIEWNLLEMWNVNDKYLMTKTSNKVPNESKLFQNDLVL